MAHKILYRNRSAKRSELLGAYFVRHSYEKPSRLSAEISLGQGSVEIRSGMSGSRDVIKIYKAFPIRNPRADIRTTTNMLSSPREEELLPISLGIRRRISYNRYARKISTYDVRRTKREALLGPRLYRRYVPSGLVTKAFFESSERIVQDFRESLSFLPTQFLRPSKKPKDVLLKETSDAIGEAVQGALETVAYRAAVFEARIAKVSDSHGYFVESFKSILYECMPVRISDMQNLLKILHKDLESFASTNPALGAWGSLHNGPEGIFVTVKATLPAKPASGDSIIVG